MAKASYPCPKCGSPITVGGKSYNRARADSYAAYRQKRGDVCDQCQREEWAQKNEKSAAADAAVGLPALEGTEKQIAWAESIRKRLLDEVEAAAPIVDRLRNQLFASDSLDERECARAMLQAAPDSIQRYHLREMLKELETYGRYDAFLALLRDQKAASWWIDCHRESLASIVLRHREMIDKRELGSRPVSTEEAEAAAEATEEATLRAACEPVSKTIAEIRHIGNAVEVHFPEKRDDFREAIKSLIMYAWNGTCWHRALGLTTGESSDRLAEVAHRLVAAGFVVRLHDTAAREKALSGQFEPEQMRWVSKCTSGKYAGWLMIKWGREDDLYSVALSLPGARYAKPCIVVPPGAIEAVAEFAAKYAFAMSKGANEILDAHRAALASGAVVTSFVDRPVAVRDDYDGKPKPISAPVDAEIDDELKD